MRFFAISLKYWYVLDIISNKEESMPKNKVKLNDKLANKKTNSKKKTIKEPKYISEESKEMRNFLIILFSFLA